MRVNCPTCQTKIEWSADNEYRPFCSKRCQLIDLGEWADESHTISTPLSQSANINIDPEDIEEMLAKQQNQH